MVALRSRWSIAVLLCLITTVNYLDRQAFAVAAPVLVTEFTLSNTQFGIITAAFLIAYAIGHVLAGPFIDRLGTKRAFSLAVAAWSVAGLLHVAGRGFWSFLSFRSLLGLTEAANFPAALKAVAEWFPSADRSLAVGIVTLGPGLGAVLSPPLLGFLITAYGWEWAFIVPGLAGFLWLWIWQRYYASPPAAAPSGRPERGQLRTLVDLLRYREVQGLLLSRFMNDGAFYFFVAWLPLYLAQARGFDLRQIAWFAWIPFLAADLGSLAGGWAGRRLIAGGLSLGASRKLLIATGAALVVLSLPAGVADSPAAALGLIGLAMFAIQAKAANLFALPTDLFPAEIVASVWGLFGAVGALGGAAFTWAVGPVTEVYGYLPVFWAVGVTQVLSALLVLWYVPEVRPLCAEASLRAGPA